MTVNDGTTIITTPKLVEMKKQQKHHKKSFLQCCRSGTSRWTCGQTSTIYVAVEYAERVACMTDSGYEVRYHYFRISSTSICGGKRRHVSMNH